MTRRTVLTLSLVTCHLLLVSCILCLVSPIHAQAPSEPTDEQLLTQQIIPVPNTGLQLLLTPSLLDLRTEPGASKSALIKIKNLGDQTEQIRVDLMKFGPDETGSKPKLMELSAEDVFPAWINFSENNFLLEAKTWKAITMNFSPPADTAPAYYFAIVFNREKEIEIQNGQVAKGAAAILCLVQINNSRVFHQLDLMSLTGKGLNFTTDKYIYEFLPANFTATLTNQGNVHELANGNIFIDWLSGKKTDVGILEVNPEKSYILPQSTRTFTASWNDGFPVWEELRDESGQPILDKKGQPRHRLQWDLSKLNSFRIGKFRAILTLAYNDGVRDIPLEATTEFWVVPWRILLGLLVLLILIIIGLKGTIQNLYRRLKSGRNKQYHVPPSTSP